MIITDSYLQQTHHSEGALSQRQHSTFTLYSVIQSLLTAKNQETQQKFHHVEARGTCTSVGTSVGVDQDVLKNGEPVGKFLYLGKYAPYAVDKHIIREHVTRWSQISGQMNSIDPGLVDAACFLKETNCINHCCHSRRLLGLSLHC